MADRAYGPPEVPQSDESDPVRQAYERYRARTGHNEERELRVKLRRLLRARLEAEGVPPVPAAPEEYWPGRWIDWV